MRPLETLLSLANLMAFLALVAPRPQSPRWTAYLIPSALPVAVFQVLLEGSRWQMIPAYALTAIFCLTWLRRRRALEGKTLNRPAAVVAAGLGALGLVVAITLPTVLPVFRFPKPTGSYTIGTLTYHWVDSSRPELFTADLNDHRELMAQVWYPAPADASGPRSPYVQNADTWAADTARVLGFPSFMFTHFKHVNTNAILAVPIATDQPRFPVLVYQTGLDGFRSISTFQIEELVSHGYVVVGLDQPGAVASVTYTDGRHIAGWPKARMDPLIHQAVWPQAKPPVLNGVALPDGITPYFGQDASFALDQLEVLDRADPNGILTHHLDLEHAGTFGISLGGMGVAEACARDVRFQACLVMDVYIPRAVVRTGLKQPTMFITRDADTMRLERRRSGGWTEKDIASTLKTMRSVYDRLPGDGYYVEIPNMFHINFTDAPYWVLPSSQLGLTGPIRAQHGFDIVNTYSLAFFDRHLKGLQATLLDEPSERYPEATLGTKRR